MNTILKTKELTYNRIIDVLNNHFGTHYTGWMKACWPASDNGKWFVWFPTISEIKNDGTYKDREGWVNYFKDSETVIVEEALESVKNPNPLFRYNNIRLVFAKDSSRKYVFYGAYFMDIEKSKDRRHVYNKIGSDVEITDGEIKIITPAENNYPINYAKLRETVDLLLKTVVKRSEQRRILPINFESGYYYEAEHYKYDIFNKAQDILGYRNWKEEEIGTGKILDRIKIVLDIYSDIWNGENNLVDYRTNDFFDKAGKDIERAERLIYELYTSEKEEQAFNNFTEYFGNKYDRTAYLLFLKDKERFLPIRPTKFEKPFKRLGITTSCLSKCTWENYIEFISLIEKVREYLSDIIGDITLLDAHSFVWSLHLLNDDIEEKEKELRKKLNNSKYKEPSYETFVGNAEADDKLVKSLVESLEESDGISYNLKPIAKPSEKVINGRKVYNRNQAVAKNALIRAGHKCEINPDHETFYRRKTNNKYTEPHHLVPMMYQDDFGYSLDREANIVSLCSTCHNWIHYGKGAEDLIKTFIKREKKN